jgi:hypothetical protein
MRLLYLKYILEQDEESTLKKFLMLQIREPNRGDWASTCADDLKELNITLSFEAIQLMTKYEFTRILKERIKENALIYLTGKRGEKGKEMDYSCLEMAEYLQPFNDQLTLKQKQEMFSIKNRMYNLPENFPKGDEKYTCVCGETENITHIYQCEILSKKKEEKISYEKIFNGNINEQIKVYQLFRQN